MSRPPAATGGRGFGRLLLVLPAAGLLACSGGGAVPDAAPPERVILIVIDMLRADHVSAYGGGTSTPNLDRLAREGVRFPHAVSAFHQTTMSMAAMFTGRTPSLESGEIGRPLEWTGKTWCGMSRFAASGEDRCIPETLPTLAESLRAAGYWTMGVASNPLVFRPGGYDQGFDDWIEVGTVTGSIAVGREITVTRAAEPVHRAVREALARRRDDRFFLYVHYMDVHDYLQEERTYARAVEVVDEALGSLLEDLRAQGLLEDAVVVVTSDHGERLGEQHALEGMPSHFGNPSFETLLRVPLIVWPRVEVPAPAVFRGQDTRRLVERLAGVDAEAATDLDPDELLLTEQFFLTYRRYPWKAMWDRRDDAFHLFDLQEDPGERKDLASEREDAARKQRVRMRELAGALAASGGGRGSELTESEKERLRALGYLN